MFDLPTKSQLLALPTLYAINNITPIIYNFLGEYLNHLNLKDSSLIIPSITLDIVKSSKTLNVSLPYSNSYKEYVNWEYGILKYNTVPNLFLVNNKTDIGPLIYLLGDVNITKTILYVISQQMELVTDSFAYNTFDGVLNYKNNPEDIILLD